MSFRELIFNAYGLLELPSPNGTFEGSASPCLRSSKMAPKKNSLEDENKSTVDIENLVPVPQPKPCIPETEAKPESMYEEKIQGDL